MKPDNHIWIILISCFLKCHHITFMSFSSLMIICFKNSYDMLMSHIDQIFCKQITSFTIVHKNVGFVFHLLIDSVNKNVGNFIFIKILIKFWMSAYNLTFTWLNDQAINIFCKNIFKTCCLSSSAIFCCLKNNAVSIFGKDTVDPLDQSREYIIRNIGCNHCNVL